MYNSAMYELFLVYAGTGTGIFVTETFILKFHFSWRVINLFRAHVTNIR